MRKFSLQRRGARKGEDGYLGEQVGESGELQRDRLGGMNKS